MSPVAIAMLTRVALLPGAARGSDMNSTAVASLYEVSDKDYTEPTCTPNRGLAVTKEN